VTHSSQRVLNFLVLPPGVPFLPAHGMKWGKRPLNPHDITYTGKNDEDDKLKMERTTVERVRVEKAIMCVSGRAELQLELSSVNPNFVCIWLVDRDDVQESRTFCKSVLHERAVEQPSETLRA